MKFSSALAVVAGLLSASSTLAAPTPASEVAISKRADGVTDTQILNFALTLEVRCFVFFILPAIMLTILLHLLLVPRAQLLRRRPQEVRRRCLQEGSVFIFSVSGIVH
jgi:hypothetical protein